MGEKDVRRGKGEKERGREWKEMMKDDDGGKGMMMRAKAKGDWKGGKIKRAWPKNNVLRAH